MRYLFGLICVLALGVMPMVGCSETAGAGGSGGAAGDGGSGGTAGNGGGGGCADWAGEWTLDSVSCDDVAETAPDADYSFAANCTGEMIITESATCEITVQMTFMPEAGGTTSDLGAVTCSAGCTADECQATADWGQPYATTISRSGDTLTSTTLVTAQMVSDEVTGCQAGETQVSVLVAK
jgi:hypothetical protein